MEHQSDFSSDDNGLSSDSNEEMELEDPDSFDGDVPSDSDEGPLCQEPLAGEDWFREYNRERTKMEERKQQLQNWFDIIVQENTCISGDKERICQNF